MNRRIWQRDEPATPILRPFLMSAICLGLYRRKMVELKRKTNVLMSALFLSLLLCVVLVPAVSGEWATEVIGAGDIAGIGLVLDSTGDAHVVYGDQSSERIVHVQVGISEDFYPTGGPPLVTDLDISNEDALWTCYTVDHADRVRRCPNGEWKDFGLGRWDSYSYSYVYPFWVSQAFRADKEEPLYYTAIYPWIYPGTMTRSVGTIRARCGESWQAWEHSISNWEIRMQEPDIAVTDEERFFIIYRWQGVLYSWVGTCLSLYETDQQLIGNWILDDSGDAGYFNSAAIGPSGVSHVNAYADDLTIDDSGNVGYFTSIAIGLSDVPHVSYYDATNGDLKYAWYNGINWQSQTVDSNGDVGYFTSIAIDAQGHPHISYYDATNGALKYAWHDGSQWNIEIVDPLGDSGKYSSLALDSQGHPHIAYYDAGNGDLKYAYYTAPSTYSIDYVVAHWVSGALNPSDPCQISLDQILQAIAWWAAATPVPQTGGQTIDLDKILDLIAKWAAGTCIDSSAAPQSFLLPKALPADEAALIVEATRSIASTAGGQMEVMVTVEAKQTITGLALDENLPQGWRITPIDNADAIFNTQETQWLWLAANAGETKTIRYQVEIPSDASLESLYEITGFIRAASPSLVLEVVGDVQLGERLPRGKLEVVAIPNPVRDVHTVTFQVRGALVPLVETIKVQIFNLAGRLIYEKEEAGASLDWHTDNSYGEYMANGVYLYKLYALVEGKWVVSEVKKLAILR